MVVHIVNTRLWLVNDTDFTVYCFWLWAQVPELLTCICCVMITQVISITHFFAQHFVLQYSTHPPTYPHTATVSRPRSAPLMLARLLRYLAVRSLLVSCALAGVWCGCVCVCVCWGLQCQHRGRPCDTLIYITVISPITAGVLRPSAWCLWTSYSHFRDLILRMLVLLSSKYIITPSNSWKIVCVFWDKRKVHLSRSLRVKKYTAVFGTWMWPWRL